MYEAVIALCLVAAGDICRDNLLPGYEAADKTACEAALDVTPPDLSPFAEYTVTDPVTCKPVGEALQVDEIAPGVFVHMGLIEEPNSDNRGDVTNLGFVIGETSVVAIDSGTARWMGEAMWRAIRARTDKPLSHVILTHMHPDHVLGAAVFAQAGAQVIGHKALPRALADRRVNYLQSLDRLIGPAGFLGTQTTEITQTVDDVLDIDLGDRSLRINAWPVAHTGTDLTVQDAETGVFFAGDLVFHLHAPALDGSVLGWQQVLQDITGDGLSPDMTQVVPGHGGPVLAWPIGAAAMKSYLDTLATDTRRAIAMGERLGEAIDHIAASEEPNWQLFDAYNPRNATVAFTELEWE